MTPKEPLKLLYKLLIRPILEYKPKSMDYDDFLEYALCTKTRIISNYTTIEELTILGNELNGVWLGQKATKVVKRSQQVVARVDDVTGTIELEHAGVVYRTSRQEWDVMRRCLRLNKKEEEL